MDSSDATSGSFVSQERCYQLMAEKMVEHSLQGFSTCLFCYGQTGTGKTTTILGKPEPTSEQGLLLRLVTDLFQQVSILGEQVQCRVQIVEVHNERVRDLLTEGTDSQNLIDLLKSVFDFSIGRSTIKYRADSLSLGAIMCHLLISTNYRSI